MVCSNSKINYLSCNRVIFINIMHIENIGMSMVKVSLAFLLVLTVTILTKRGGTLRTIYTSKHSTNQHISIQLCSNNNKHSKNSSKTFLTVAKLKVLAKIKPTQKETAQTGAPIKSYGCRKFKFGSAWDSNLKLQTSVTLGLLARKFHHGRNATGITRFRVTAVGSSNLDLLGIQI